MGSATMGRTVVTAKIENLKDLYLASQKGTKKRKVRSIEVTDALVDSGATFLSLPTRLVKHLGLGRVRTRRVLTTGGVREASAYEAVRLTIQGRDCVVEVVEIPDNCPVLIGQLPLEAMDFVIHPKGQKLIGNPEHGGEWISDQF
jgi:predicted aspartyl protease